MATYYMDMVLQYAKVFPHNMDTGNPDGNRIQKDIARKGGQFIVNAYLTSEEDKQKLLDDGVDPKPLGHDRFVKGDDFGIGEFIKLKSDAEARELTFDNGNSITVGGPPKIVNFTDGENVVPWDNSEMGDIGNGTKAKVKFSTYSRGAGFRLEGIAVTELVEWVEQEPDPAEDLFA